VTSSRERRRARAGLEAAYWDLEAALALGRDAAAAEVAWQKARARLFEEDAHAADARRMQLRHALEHGGEALRAYAKEHGLGGASCTTTSGGVRIVRLVTESFPRHVNYVYLVELDDTLLLWDCGSGLGRARSMILDGMALSAMAFDFIAEPKDIDVILVSHGHYDHFGDAPWWKTATGAPLWIHELDARVVENFEERTVLTGRDMAVWLASAGCPDDDVRELVSMYLASKEVYSSVPVDRRLRHGQRLFPNAAGAAARAHVIHTPGHCPGHLCLRIDDALLVADQVLAPITPHLSPQALHPQNGLERYLVGLARLVREEGVRHVLPAHYDPIPDLPERVGEIAQDHVEKLQRTQLVCREGGTILEVAQALFGHQEGYNVLLALLEAGTHVEYLHQVGALVVTDLESAVDNPRLPFRFRATDVEVVEGNALFDPRLGGG
jgi:glyoxylase-like metal-dependent hydrolase (beta-lactamase superfamily II)